MQVTSSGWRTAAILAAIVTTALSIAWGEAEKRVDQHDQRICAIEQYIRETSRQTGAMEASLASIDKRLDRIETEIGKIRVGEAR